MVKSLSVLTITGKPRPYILETNERLGLSPSNKLFFNFGVLLAYFYCRQCASVDNVIKTRQVILTCSRDFLYDTRMTYSGMSFVPE